mmetsp:Transcript_27099/g.35348  ORF Transcript_27099/g.35348 Transcript_27099/m.35348 type:complete len:89 (-) Transcript_27099:218-484(-)|eukprot:CAMPEP_0195260232 /NCGR_PEP_ID=MMETSP0706-20130129/8457_1 /TAXON_ID=33640 /ORGANISM="Asterionellopsis glacialis, Strain CCMP134" /LENGTH=88 /DNA_ID=CAMNT_0040313923 /DNA_START=287 /DNA_END=553 /DNA_ORIENTATION=+
MGLSAAAAVERRLPNLRASAYHFAKDWYLGHLNKSSPNGNDRNNMAYKITPALQTSALVPSYPGPPPELLRLDLCLSSSFCDMISGAT